MSGEVQRHDREMCKSSTVHTVGCGSQRSVGMELRQLLRRHWTNKSLIQGEAWENHLHGSMESVVKSTRTKVKQLWVYFYTDSRRAFIFLFDKSPHWLPSSPYNSAFTVPLLLQSLRIGISWSQDKKHWSTALEGCYHYSPLHAVLCHHFIKSSP